MPKLYSSRHIIKILQKNGFFFVSQRGSHVKYRKTGKPTLTAIVPAGKKEIPHGTLRSMLKTIIFDFDGVLGDTYQINFETCREFFPDLSEQEFKDYHNGNVFKSNIMQWTTNDLLKFFKKQKKKFTKGHLFPLKKVLTELQKKYQLLVISSTMDDCVRYFLSLGGYNQFFQKIYGSTTHKSKVEKLKMIFKQYNLKPNQCLFITDTIGDIKEARDVNIDSIAVAWGYHNKELLSSQKPLAIVQKPDDLLQAIEKHSR